MVFISLTPKGLKGKDDYGVILDSICQELGEMLLSVLFNVLKILLAWGRGASALGVIC